MVGNKKGAPSDNSNIETTSNEPIAPAPDDDLPF